MGDRVRDIQVKYSLKDKNKSYGVWERPGMDTTKKTGFT